jgi:hypothetical protein
MPSLCTAAAELVLEKRIRERKGTLFKPRSQVDSIPCSEGAGFRRRSTLVS